MNRTFLRHGLWFVLIGLAGGFLIAWMGLVPIAASRGHWPPAEWFLHFTMRESVQTRARNIDAPGFSDPLAVRRGAGAYAVICAGCHGAPGQAQGLFATRMTPPAPRLESSRSNWKTRELFWIVRNGIKYTAMPAWPTQRREDEVWSMVAFLRELPGMSAHRYRELAFGSSALDTPLEPLVRDAPGARWKSCTHCHGTDGMGGNGAAPALAAQNAEYLLASLRDYATGRRHSGVMQTIATGLREGELLEFSRRFASMPVARRAAGADLPEDTPRRRRGGHIAEQGIAERGVAPCAACHGRDGRSGHPRYPNLIGLDGADLELQLQLFRSGVRSGTPAAALMRSVSQGLDPDDIAAVADHYAHRGR